MPTTLTKYSTYAAQIVFAFEELGLDAAGISAQFIDSDSGLTEGTVSALLEEHSKKYRERLRGLEKAATIGFSTNALEELISEYRKLAFCSDNDLVRERALKHLIDELKGRNDIPLELLKLKTRDTQANEVNTAMKIAEFNATMKKNRDAVAETMKKYGTSTTPKPVDPTQPVMQLLELQEA